MASPNRILRIVTLDLGAVNPPEEHPDFGTPTVIQAFAIDTGAGVFLVDTGLGESEPVIEVMYRPARRSLVRAPSESGLNDDRIVGIVVSHLHFDHAGALCDFPGIPIHVQREEIEAARQPRYRCEFPRSPCGPCRATGYTRSSWPCAHRSRNSAALSDSLSASFASARGGILT